MVLGILDGKERQERPNREWTDDIRECPVWCKQDLHVGLHSLTRIVQKRGLRKQMIKFAMDTYGLSAHGPWWWWHELHFNDVTDMGVRRNVFREWAHFIRGERHGRRLRGDWEDRPPRKNVRWGTAHVLLPSIFWEILLSDVSKSKNWRKNVSRRNVLFRNRVFLSRFLSRKGVIYQISDSRNRERQAK